MENVIVVLILVAIAAGIIWYLIRAKKRGEKCVGCPYAKQCGSKCCLSFPGKRHKQNPVQITFWHRANFLVLLTAA